MKMKLRKGASAGFRPDVQRTVEHGVEYDMPAHYLVDFPDVFEPVKPKPERRRSSGKKNAASKAAGSKK